MTLCSKLNFDYQEALHTSVDDAIALCLAYNKIRDEEQHTWRVDMFNFACLVNADKKGRAGYIKTLNKQVKEPQTPEQEREALLKLKSMLQ